MIWRAGTGFLIDGPFRLIDATGTISRRFEDSATEDGLDVDITTYVIRDGRLIEVTTMERTGWETLPAERETIVLGGLMEDPSDEAGVPMGCDSVLGRLGVPMGCDSVLGRLGSGGSRPLAPLSPRCR